jgi:anti-sigma-K factor RskA
MNAERHEDLAALAALDLLTPTEQAEVTAALAQHPELATLAGSLRSTAAELAHTAPAAEPPADLKIRLLKTIAGDASAARAPIVTASRSTILPFPTWIGFATAACFACLAAYFAQAYFNQSALNSAFRDQQNLADLSLRSTKNQLAAERLISQRELADAAKRAGDTAALITTLESRLAETKQQLFAQGTLADYKIATLASLLGNSPQAVAVAIWNPASQEGVLTVQKLPALAADKDYQLWVIDPQYSIPVDGGVFKVDPTTGEGRLVFHPNRPVQTVAKFAVSLERKGGVPKAEGPMVLIGP